MAHCQPPPTDGKNGRRTPIGPSISDSQQLQSHNPLRLPIPRNTGSAVGYVRTRRWPASIRLDRFPSPLAGSRRTPQDRRQAPRRARSQPAAFTYPSGDSRPAASCKRVIGSCSDKADGKYQELTGLLHAAIFASPKPSGLGTRWLHNSNRRLPIVIPSRFGQ